MSTQHRIYTKDHTRYNYFTASFLASVHPDDVARTLELEYVGPIADLGYHLFRQSKTSHHHQATLDRYDALFNAPAVLLKRRDAEIAASMHEFRHQVPKRRLFRRDLTSTIQDKLSIRDPLFPKQWHIINEKYRGNDLNVTGVWLDGVTGKGVTVCMIDDGLDYTHPDLKDNFSLDGSYDFNNKTKLPFPWHSDDVHGTRCAGEIAAAKNHVCGVGMAYDAKVSGIRILSAPLTEDDEALALYYANQVNDIYSCSWGPPDNGKSMDAPAEIVKKAFLKSIEEGRGGKGVIFVFATGNGAMWQDDCNFDGYTNSPYTITIGAIDWQNRHPNYSEKCSAQLAVTYSSGSGEFLHTTDVHNGCTGTHGGTSAAAPLVSGVMALALSVRPELTWRDAQYLVVETAVPFNLNDPSWQTTPSGRPYSHTFGYGKIDTYRIVQLAKTFKLVGPPVQMTMPTIKVEQRIPGGDDGINSTLVIDKNFLVEGNFKRLEQVTVRVNIKHQRRGEVQIRLYSPSGMVSIFSPGREYDDSRDGFKDWRFMSVVHWGEDPVGTWTLNVKDPAHRFRSGFFVDWTAKFWGEHGLPEAPVEPAPPKTAPLPPPSKITRPQPIEAPTTAPTPPQAPATTSTAVNTEKPVFHTPTKVLPTATSTTTQPTATKEAAKVPDTNDQGVDANSPAAILLLFAIFVLAVVGLVFVIRKRMRSNDFVPLSGDGGDVEGGTSKELLAAFGAQESDDDESGPLFEDDAIELEQQHH
jgi:kexin